MRSAPAILDARPGLLPRGEGESSSALGSDLWVGAAVPAAGLPLPGEASRARPVAGLAVTWSGVLGRIAVSLGLAVALYAGTVRFLIEPYIVGGSDAGRVLGVYRAYERLRAERAAAGADQPVVLFWGSSMIREAVDTRILAAVAPGWAAYNFGLNGDLPNRRLVELPPARALRPRQVVIGVSYRDLFNEGRAFEDQVAVLPASAYAVLPPEAEALLDARDRRVARSSAWTRFWWKRRFTLSAAFWALGVPDRTHPAPRGFADNFTCPNLYSKSHSLAELKGFLADRAHRYPPYSDPGPLDPARSTAARSLALMVKTLGAQGAQVAVVNMPLHPLLNELVPADRRQSYLAFLGSLASPSVQVLDLQDKLPCEHFIDLVHVNAAGREAFTRAVGRRLRAEAPDGLETRRPLSSRAGTSRSGGRSARRMLGRWGARRVRDARQQRTSEAPPRTTTDALP